MILNSVSRTELRIHLPEANRAPPDPQVDSSDPDCGTAVAPGVSASLASAGPSLRRGTLVSLTFAFLADPVLAASAGQAGKPSALGDYPVIVQRVVQACDIETLGIGDLHRLPGSLAVITGAMKGFLATTQEDDTPPVQFQEWCFPPGQFQMKYDQQDELASATGRREWANHWLKMTPPSAEGSPVRAEFREALADPRLSVLLVNWQDPSVNEVARIAATPGRKLVSLGLAHWLNAMPELATDTSTTPYLGDHGYNRDTGVFYNLHQLHPSLQRPNLNQAQQQKIMDVLTKLQSAGPVMYLMSSRFWTESKFEKTDPGGKDITGAQARDRYLKHYNSKKQAVLEIPLPQGINVSALVPASCLNELREIVAEFPAVRLFYEGDTHVEATAPTSHQEL
ncbi:MAG: hypothetical protein H7255_04140 [Ramlibacter sp.]|nr:hypothetical protein [Ramlibacter sp.]